MRHKKLKKNEFQDILKKAAGYKAKGANTVATKFLQPHCAFWLLITVLVFFTAMTSTTNAAYTYYVNAATGNDTNDGSSGSPWLTIPYTWSTPRGGNTIAESDTILFATGDYGDFVESTSVATGYIVYRNNWITYKADPNASTPQNPPVLTSITVANSDKAGNLVDGGESLWTAGSGDTVTADSSIKISGTSSCKVELQAERSAGDKLAYFELASDFVIDSETWDGMHYFLYQKDAAITAGDYKVVYCSSTDGSLTGDFAELACKAKSANAWRQSRFLVSDIRGLTIKSVALYANATIPNGTIINIDHLVAFGNGRSYFHFEGFRVDDGVDVQSTSYIKFVDCDIESAPDKVADVLVEGYYKPYFALNDSAMDFGDTHFATIEDCEISNAYKGILIAGGNNIIKNNTVHHISADGIILNAPAGRDGIDDILVEGNTVYDLRPKSTEFTVNGTISEDFTVGETVTQGTTNTTGVVISNTATVLTYYVTSETSESWGFERNSDAAYNITGAAATLSAISFTGGAHSDGFTLDITNQTATNLVITGNNIDLKRDGTDVGFGTVDVQGIKLYGRGADNLISVTITNNLVIAGVAIIGGSFNNAIINNNTFFTDYDDPDIDVKSGLALHTRNNVGSSVIAEFCNNICENTSIVEELGKTITFTVHENNIFGPTVDAAYPELSASEERLADSAAIKALFTDVSGTRSGSVGDYTLAEGSLARNFGNPNKGPETDILGVTRNDERHSAGAYEFTGPTDPDDDFSDNQMGNNWQLHAEDPNNIWLDETNQRLELRSGDGLAGIAEYISNQWMLDPSLFFSMKIDFHYDPSDTPDTGDDGRVFLSISPSLSNWEDHYLEFSAGRDEIGNYFYYEAINGNPDPNHFDRITRNDADGNGSLYLFYYPEVDELNLSYTDGESTKAWQTVSGLIQGTWNSNEIYVSIGGDSKYVVHNSGDAYLDNFVVVDGSDIISHWSLDDGSGSIAGDSAGSNDGRIYGAGWAVGEIGGALTFNGVSDYVDCGYDSSFAITDEITISAWVKTTGGYKNYIIAKEDSFFLCVGSGVESNTIAFYLKGASSAWVHGTTDLTDNQWHHVAATYDGSAMKVYVDGVLEGTNAASGAISTGTAEVLIGNRKNKFYYTGSLDDVKIYSIPLDSVEIAALYGANQAPVANAGPDQNLTDTDDNGSESVSLDGSSSSDSDGNIVSWVWTDDLGDAIPAQETVNVALSVGTHTITLTVTDDDGETDTDTVTITIQAPGGGGTPVPVSHWSLDEGSGSIASDSVGSNDGTIYGAGWAVGEIGGALTFNGVSDYVDCGYGSSLAITDEITISAWVKTNKGYKNYIIAKEDSFFLCVGSGVESNTIAFYLKGASSGWVHGTTDLTDNQWHHVVATYDGSATKVYVDGVLEGSRAASGAISTGPANALIGSRRNKFYCTGTLDDIRIYSTPLDAAEVVALYGGQPPANQAPASNAGVNQTVTDSDDDGSEDVTLDGSGSSDPDGTIASYAWSDSLGDTIPAGINPAVSLSVGTHTITLTVTDDGGATDTDTVVITVEALGGGDTTVLVSHWTLDEDSGNTAGDSVGTNDGRVYGAGWTNGALTFNGASDYVNCGNDSSLAITDEITISAWVKTNKGYKNYIIAKEDSFFLCVGSGVESNTIAFYLKGASSAWVHGTTDLTDNQWHHVVATYDGSATKVYVDGVLEGSRAASGAISTGPANALIGSRRNKFYCTGTLDDIRIYSTPLDAAEVVALYGANQAPIANAGDNQTVTDSDDNGSENVTLDGSGSSDPDGTIASYTWSDSLGDTIPSGMNPTTALSVGTHTITLTVTDDGGATDTDTVVITVEALGGGDTTVLVSHWTLDEDSGNTAGDSVGTNDGKVYGAGWTNGALTFNGIGDYVNCGNDSLAITDEITISAWVKTNKGFKKYIIAKEDSFFLCVGSGVESNTIGFFLRGASSGWLHGTTDLTDNQWHHVAATYDGSSMKVYVDGVLEGTKAASGAISTGTADVLIGSRRNKFYYTGTLDDIRIYSTPLDAAGIDALYNY